MNQDEITFTELQDRYGWSAADIHTAIGVCGLPEPMFSRMPERVGRPSGAREPVWDRHKIHNWEDAWRALGFTRQAITEGAASSRGSVGPPAA